MIMLLWTSCDQFRALLTWSECGVTYMLVFIWNDPWWITFTFCCDNLWKSKYMALKKLGNFSLCYYVATVC